MENSIEAIWKNGFLRNDALVAPKLNNLYSQKSKHLIDRFKRRYQINHVYIVLLATIHLLIGIAGHVPMVGVFTFLLLMPLLLIARRQTEKLKALDKSVNSYEYLHSFNGWLKGLVKTYGRFYRWFYPLYFPAVALGMLFSDRWIQDLEGSPIDLVMSDSETWLVLGVPMVVVIPLTLLVVISALFSKKLYEVDMKMVYGRLMNRIEEISEDIEELRK